MDSLFPADLQNISRREFLKLAGAGLLALLFTPLRKAAASLLIDPIQPTQGRVTANSVNLYDQASFSGTLLKVYWRDLVVPITGVTVGDVEPAYNRIWYQLEELGYAHSGSIQPVEVRINPVRTDIPPIGRLAEVTVPFTDALWDPLKSSRMASRLYFGTTHWVIGSVQDDAGVVWYHIPDDKWNYTSFARAEHLRLVELSDLQPLSAEVPAASKRIEILREQQVLVAYEEDTPVFMTRIASGARFSDGDFTTPAGRFTTNRKRPSRHMAAGDLAAPNSYNLPGVPWVSYLTENGIAIHGTYWHNDYGKPRSHGCINVTSTAARWIYRWCLPSVPENNRYINTDEGTQVNII